MVPELIVENYREDRRRGEFQAVGMFLDLSGFSTMTDSLMQHGQHGAEVLAGLMHSVFDPLVESIFHYGGKIVGFAGDGIMALYPIESDARSTALRALTAAYQIEPPAGLLLSNVRVLDTQTGVDREPVAYGDRVAHERGGRDAHMPGFYLHLEPGHSRGGGGLWHPDGPALAKVRARIVSRPSEWSAIRRRIDLEGERLQRVPPGYDAAHQHAADLKLKDYYVMESFSDRQVTGRGFMDDFVAVCRRTNPLLKFLAGSLDLSW